MQGEAWAGNQIGRDWSEWFRQPLALHGRPATKTRIHRRAKISCGMDKRLVVTIGDFERPCGLPCHVLHLARHYLWLKV